jgi:hypothetical protein
MELVSRTNTSIATVYNLCGEQSMTYSLCKGVLQEFIGYDPSRNLVGTFSQLFLKPSTAKFSNRISLRGRVGITLRLLATNGGPGSKY